ncbi:MAG: hypothetical protein IJV07_05635 [Alphaproteobacteria bacterium]|nr:hypothetical protein [Alphaproteobacteria bacterium]
MTTEKTEQLSLSTTLNAEDVFSDWNQLLETPLFDDAELNNLQLEEQGQAYWENLFNSMNFPGMDLMAVNHYAQDNSDLIGRQKQLNRTIRDFVRFLSYHHANDLRSAGVTEEGLFYMKRGQQPENFVVHLKYPLDYGGTISFENMVFIQARPFHDLIHRYIDKQIIGPEGYLTPKQLYVPVPRGKVYIPMGLFTGSGGKNKQDRSVLSGFTQSALRDIALKTMPGR